MSAPDKEDGFSFQQVAKVPQRAHSRPLGEFAGLGDPRKARVGESNHSNDDPCSPRYIQYWYLWLSMLLECSPVR